MDWWQSIGRCERGPGCQTQSRGCMRAHSPCHCAIVLAQGMPFIEELNAGKDYLALALDLAQISQDTAVALLVALLHFHLCAQVVDVEVVLGRFSLSIPSVEGWDRGRVCIGSGRRTGAYGASGRVEAAGSCRRTC